MTLRTPATIFTALLALALAVPAAAAPLGTDLVRDAMLEAARASLPDTVVSVDVHGVQVRGNVEIPSKADVEVLIRAEGDEDWIGRVSAEAEIFVNGSTVRTVRVLGTITAHVEVAVLRNPVPRGATISPSDVALARRDASSLPKGLVMQPGSLIGRTTKRDLGLNQLVTEGDLLEHTDALRNRPVTLVVRSGALTVASPGVLRKDGRIGELVEVLATSTNSTVYGILISPDVVEVPTISNATSSSLSSR